MSEEVDYQDLLELEQLKDQLVASHHELAKHVIELAELQGQVLKVKAQVDVFKDAKKDIEEQIRIKKLQINTKPRG